MAELDFAIGYSPLEHPDIQADVLAEGKLVVVVRPGHPILARGKDKRHSRLREYPHASPKALYGTATCEDHPLIVKWNAIGDVPFYFDSYDVARSYVLHSNAW